MSKIGVGSLALLTNNTTRSSRHVSNAENPQSLIIILFFFSSDFYHEENVRYIGEIYMELCIACLGGNTWCNDLRSVLLNFI